jgi:hypothetical protein
MQRALSLAMGDRQLTRQPERSPTRHYAHIRHQIRELAAALDRMDETPQAGAALNVRLHERERARDYGLGL